MPKAKITKNMTFRELIENYPETAEVFSKHGIHCIGCVMAAFETIEQGARAHGIDVKKFVEELNKAVKEEK